MSRLGTLKNTVALVTGGASGLGRATVERFVQQGARVAILDLPSSAGEEVASKLNKEHAGSCAFTPADVTSEADVKKALDWVHQHFGCLHTLVNCARIGVAKRTVNFGKKESHSLELFNKVLMGLADLMLDKQPSFIIVSNGADCVQIKKSFYLQNCSEKLQRDLKQSLCPYPSDDNLQESLQISVDWNAHRKSELEHTVGQVHTDRFLKQYTVAR